MAPDEGGEGATLSEVYRGVSRLEAMLLSLRVEMREELGGLVPRAVFDAELRSLRARQDAADTRQAAIEAREEGRDKEISHNRFTLLVLVFTTIGGPVIMYLLTAGHA